MNEEKVVALCNQHTRPTCVMCGQEIRLSDFDNDPGSIRVWIRTGYCHDCQDQLDLGV